MKSFKSFAVPTFAAVFTLVSVTVSTPAQACPFCSGVKLNGTELNGFQLNGFQLNGVQFNGAGKNVAGLVVAVTLPKN